MTGISGAGSYMHNVGLPVNGGTRIPADHLIAVNPDGDLIA